MKNLSGLFLNGQPIAADKNNYLGENFEVRDQFTIELEFPSSVKAWIFDENFDSIQLKKDIASEHNVFDKRIFIKRVSVLCDVNKNITTLPKQNHINVLEKTREMGVLRAREISIVAQNGKFFLIEQTNLVTVYRNGLNAPVFPEADIKKWQELLEMIFSQDDIQKLKPISEYKTTPQTAMLLGTNVGVVLGWRVSTGAGAIFTEKGVRAKVYWGEIKDMKGLKKLEAGNTVRFSALEKIWNRKEGATLEYQALGVRVVI